MGCEGVGAESEGFDGGEEDGVFGFLCGEGGGGEGEEEEDEGVEELHFAVLVRMTGNVWSSEFDIQGCL